MTAGRSVKSLSQDWCTPPKYVEAVRKMFEGTVDLDPCSNACSIVAATHEICLPEDGLALAWNFSKIYVNPPYGNDIVRKTTIRDWLKKCAKTHDEFHSEVLALVPVATNTRHWKEAVFGKASAICFLFDTRLKFLIADSLENKGAPMACAMIYWGERIDRFRTIFSIFGAVVDISDLKSTG